MKQTSLIFDFDGTIADTLPSSQKVRELFNELAEKLGFKKKITLADVERFRENSLYDIIKELKIPFFKLPFIIQTVNKQLRKDLLVSEPILGMEDALLTLKKIGFSLNIITSTRVEVVKDFLKRNKLDIFDHIHSQRNLFGKDKTIKAFLKKQGIPAEQAIYIGDEIRDIQAAKKSDIKIASVLWGFNNRKGLEKYLPDFIIETPNQLSKLFAHIH